MPSSVWVLGPDVVITRDGEPINPEESNFIWISHLDCRSPVQAIITAVPISICHPLGSSGLHQVISAMSSIMGQKFYPALVSVVMALHYVQQVNKLPHTSSSCYSGTSLQWPPMGNGIMAVILLQRGLGFQVFWCTNKSSIVVCTTYMHIVSCSYEFIILLPNCYVLWSQETLLCKF